MEAAIQTSQLSTHSQTPRQAGCADKSNQMNKNYYNISTKKLDLKCYVSCEVFLKSTLISTSVTKVFFLHIPFSVALVIILLYLNIQAYVFPQ